MVVLEMFGLLVFCLHVLQKSRHQSNPECIMAIPGKEKLNAALNA